MYLVCIVHFIWIYTLHCILTAEDECHRVVVLCILYHISMSDKCSALFSYTDCIPMVGVLCCMEDLVVKALLCIVEHTTLHCVATVVGLRT